MFTDSEVMLADTHRRDMNRMVGGAQALVDRKNADLREAYSEITMLRSALAIARDDLRTEQAARIKAEAQLDHVLKLVDAIK